MRLLIEHRGVLHEVEPALEEWDFSKSPARNVIGNAIETEIARLLLVDLQSVATGESP